MDRLNSTTGMSSDERWVDEETQTDSGVRSVARFGALFVLSGVLFACGLFVTEYPGEIALDVDLKPFVIPYLLILVVGYGLPTLTVGIGAAAGEGLLDIFEGYEIDDPVGFLGYALGFVVFGWYLYRVADDPDDRGAQIVAAVLGAFVQALFEGLAFYAFDPDVAPRGALFSILGNTVTHGILLGAIPLVVLSPVVVPALAATLPSLITPTQE
jgi:hypothetical protein